MGLRAEKDPGFNTRRNCTLTLPWEKKGFHNM